MKDHFFGGWSTGSTAEPSNQSIDNGIACLWWLDGSYANQFSLLASANQNDRVARCHSLAEASLMIENNQFDVVIIDVNLGDEWPMSIASHITELSGFETRIIFLCSGSELDGKSISQIERKNHNIDVVMKSRFLVSDLISYCNILRRIKGAKPLV